MKTMITYAAAAVITTAFAMWVGGGVETEWNDRADTWSTAVSEIVNR